MVAIGSRLKSDSVLSAQGQCMYALGRIMQHRTCCHLEEMVFKIVGIMLRQLHLLAHELGHLPALTRQLPRPMHPGAASAEHTVPAERFAITGINQKHSNKRMGCGPTSRTCTGKSVSWSWQHPGVHTVQRCCHCQRSDAGQKRRGTA